MKHIFVQVFAQVNPPSILIHLPPFINRLKITLKVLLKQKSDSKSNQKSKSFYCTKFVTDPLKGLRLEREMQECTIEFSKYMYLETFLLVVHISYTVLFYKKKTMKKYQKSK